MSKFILIIFIFLVLVWRLGEKDFSQKAISAAKYQSPFQRLSKPKNIFARRIEQSLPEPQAGLLNGIIWGIKTNLPFEFYEALKKTGTLHIVVISGANIAILINILSRWLYFLGRRLSMLLTLVFLGLFIGFVGAEPPVLRAGLMGAVSLANLYFGRREYSLLSLVGVVVAMLIFDPRLIGQLSFQLSFSATLGMILFGFFRPAPQLPHNLGTKRLGDESAENNEAQLKSFFNWLRPLGEMAKVDLIITLSAQTFTLPIILVNFGQLSLIAPLANVLVGWLVPIITISGLFLSLLPIGKILLILLWPLLTYFVSVVTLLSRVPMAAVNIGKIAPWLALVYYLVLLGGMLIIYKNRNGK